MYRKNLANKKRKIYRNIFPLENVKNNGQLKIKPVFFGKKYNVKFTEKMLAAGLSIKNRKIYEICRYKL